jgi:hypothetical protein
VLLATFAASSCASDSATAPVSLRLLNTGGLPEYSRSVRSLKDRKDRARLRGSLVISIFFNTIIRNSTPLDVAQINTIFRKAERSLMLAGGHYNGGIPNFWHSDRGG